jgi:transcriptional regulator GlxA family with amidase domain
LLGGPYPAAPLLNYLQRAATLQIPLVGLCTGSFILARAGLMQNRRCCVSWFHHEDFVMEFPSIDVDSDVLYVVDSDRLTCAGGTSVVLLASHMIEAHCGRGSAAKARRIMSEDAAVPVAAPSQPQPPDTRMTNDVRLRRVISLLERNIDKPLSIEFTARHVRLSARQLERLFVRDLGTSPSEFAISLRLAHGRRLVAGSRDTISDIALQCGFTSSGHFARRFRAAFGQSPIEWRKQCASKMTLSLSA